MNIINNNFIVYSFAVEFFRILNEIYKNRRKLNVIFVTEESQDDMFEGFRRLKFSYVRMEDFLNQYENMNYEDDFLIVFDGVDFMNCYSSTISEINRLKMHYLILTNFPYFSNEFDRSRLSDNFLEAGNKVKSLYLVEENNILTIEQFIENEIVSRIPKNNFIGILGRMVLRISDNINHLLSFILVMSFIILVLLGIILAK